MIRAVCNLDSLGYTRRTYLSVSLVERICRSYQKCQYQSIFYFALAAMYNRPLSNLRTVQDITQQKLHAQDIVTLYPNVF
jgi:hypothetical protein